MLPDLILRWSDVHPATRVHSPEIGVIEAMPDSGRTGEHRPDGFALVLGAAQRSGSMPPLRHIQDFPSAVRHLLGVHST